MISFYLFNSIIFIIITLLHFIAAISWSSSYCQYKKKDAFVLTYKQNHGLIFAIFVTYRISFLKVIKFTQFLQMLYWGGTREAKEI